MKKKFKNFIKIIYPFGYADKKIIFWYSLGHYLLKKGSLRLSLICEYIILKKYNCAISCQAIIDKSVILPHPIGIVIGGGCVIEKNVTIYQNVTLGRKNKNVPFYPKLCSGTVIYCSSTIIGNIELAENTIIGANSVINFSTDKNSLYIGNPAKKIIKEKNA